MAEARVDYTRTCEGCPDIRREEWAKGRVCFRCFAPGVWQGYVVGVERYLPYVPAWCPRMKEESVCTKN